MKEIGDGVELATVEENIAEEKFEEDLEDSGEGSDSVKNIGASCLEEEPEDDDVEEIEVFKIIEEDKDKVEEEKETEKKKLGPSIPYRCVCPCVSACMHAYVRALQSGNKAKPGERKIFLFGRMLMIIVGLQASAGNKRQVSDGVHEQVHPQI